MDLLDVRQDRLALGVHLDHAHPLGRDGLLVAAAHDDLAPREVHLVPLAEGRDDLVRVGALRALDGLRDDVGAGVPPRGAERRLLLRPLLVALHPLGELRVTLLHRLVVPCEAGRDGAHRRLLAEGIQLVRVADGGADEVELVEEAEGLRLLDEGDLLGAPHRAEEGVRPRLEQCGDVGAVVGLAELRPILLDDLHVGLELLQVGGELVPHVVAVLVVGRDVRPLLVRQRGRLLGQCPDVLVDVVGGVGDVLVAVVPGQPGGLAVRREVEGLGLLGVRRDGQPHAARDAAGQEVDLFLPDQLAGGLHGLVRLELVVAEDELDGPAQHAAGVVDLLGGHEQTFLVGEGVHGGEPAVGVDLADADRLALSGGRGDRADQDQGQYQEGRRHVHRSCSHGLPPTTVKGGGDSASARGACQGAFARMGRSIIPAVRASEVTRP